ncbi:TPA: hypothetical protein ACXNHV_002351 [Serratia marcescens]
MIDKYLLEDLSLRSDEKGELARWVIQLQTDVDTERRKSASLESVIYARDTRIAELEAKLATPVRLPNKNDDEFWFDGVFQVARFDRAVERAVSTAGFKFVGEE